MAWPCHHRAQTLSSVRGNPAELVHLTLSSEAIRARSVWHSTLTILPHAPQFVYTSLGGAFVVSCFASFQPCLSVTFSCKFSGAYLGYSAEVQCFQCAHWHGQVVLAELHVFSPVRPGLLAASVE